MISRLTKSKLWRLVIAVSFLGGVLWLAPNPLRLSYAQEGETQYQTESMVLEPDGPDTKNVPQPILSAQEMDRMIQMVYQARLDAAAPYNSEISGVDPDGPSDPGVESTADFSTAGKFHGAPEVFVVGSNIQNPMAKNAGNSTLAEPAAAQEGPKIFYAGNFAHNEFSVNGGANWTNLAVPGGPADAPIPCCDWDAVYEQGRGVTFASTLYLNAARTNGVVRIFIRRDIKLPYNCSYTIDPAGASNNTLPDYPHINVSNDFLYLTVNNIGGLAGSRARVYRFNLDQMVDCVGTATSAFDYVWAAGVGQRVFVPIEGARETMYWFMHENSTTLRIFSWPETGGVSSVLKVVNASTFGINEDCTGGIGNADWWDSLAASIIGFNHRGALGNGRLHLYWNVDSDASHTQGHIHGAIFAVNPSGTGHVVGNLLALPVIYNNSFCFGWPFVSANERGDVGMVLAVGGNLGIACAGLGCSAAQPAVGIDDDYTTSLGLFNAGVGVNFTIYAGGTHNRADARYGDYFTIHPHEPCDLWFGATGYALNGGTSVINVNARFIEFGRQRDRLCYSRWDDEEPLP